MITSKVRIKPRWPDSLSLSSNQGRENDSVSIKHCTGSYSEYIYLNINLITGNQPIMATIFRLLFIDHKVNNSMSNAVTSISAPLA